MLVWRLDRWGRSLVDLVVTLKELVELGVAFVSLTEALDLTTSRPARSESFTAPGPAKPKLLAVSISAALVGSPDSVNR